MLSPNIFVFNMKNCEKYNILPQIMNTERSTTYLSA